MLEVVPFKACVRCLLEPIRLRRQLLWQKKEIAQELINWCEIFTAEIIHSLDWLVMLLQVGKYYHTNASFIIST